MGIIKRYDLECDFCQKKYSEDYDINEFELIGQIMLVAKERDWDYKKLKGIQRQKWRCPECVKQKKGE
jgi:hypothetical protein